MKGRAFTTALLMAGASLLAFPAAAQQSVVPPADEGEEIVVTGQRGALNEAVEQERRADTLVNIVTADDMGQFGDQNTAEALQRLPGVTIERNEGEGRTVSVRGLPPGFTQVTINGARVGTSEAGSSTVALDVVPSDLLGQIELNKTYTPDMDGDTIGGAIELKSLSAFQHRRPYTNARIEGSLSEYTGIVSPKASVAFARRLLDDTLGVALTGSYFKRFIDGDDLRNEQGLLPITRGGTQYLYPREVNQRHEIGVRERFGGTLNVEYRPTPDQEYFIRGQVSQLNDDDVRVQSQWQTERALGSEVQQIEDGAGRFIDVRLRNMIFFMPTKDRLWTVSAGNRNRFGAFELSTQFDYSRSRWSQEEGIRGRFEIDDIGQVARFGRDNVYTEFFRDRTRPDPFNLASYPFNNLLFIEEERADEIATGRIDLRYDFAPEGYLQTGFKRRTRDKSADKTEYNGDPRTAGFNVTLNDVEPMVDPNTNFLTFGPFPSVDTARNLFTEARDALLLDPRFLRRDNSAAGDYRLGEDVTSGYAMGSYDFAPAFRLIGGVRVEHTQFSSQGFFLETDDNGLDETGSPVRAVDLGTVERTYTHWLPSAVLRWEPSANLLARASYGRGVKRPEFVDSLNRQEVRFSADDPDSTRRLLAGNPYLQALTSDNFDVSLAWFPARGSSIQAALFHKEISNFFVPITTADLSVTPLILPDLVSTDFDRIFITINGGRAHVSGLELSLSQTFPNAPGLLSGLFLTGNMTLTRSEADVSVRPDDVFSFPGQAGLTANVSVGYENDFMSLRTSVNHRGESLFAIGALEREDVYRAPYTQADINIRFMITDEVQIYADAINVFAYKDTRYYRGERFGIFERVQDFGPTYQVGARVSF